MKDKKGQVGNVLDALPGIAIAFVIAAVVFAVGLLITSDVGADMTADSAAANATEDAIEGMSNVTGKFPLFGTIVAAVIVITLIIGGLYFGKRK